MKWHSARKLGIAFGALAMGLAARAGEFATASEHAGPPAVELAPPVALGRPIVLARNVHDAEPALVRTSSQAELPPRTMPTGLAGEPGQGPELAPPPTRLAPAVPVPGLGTLPPGATVLPPGAQLLSPGVGFGPTGPAEFTGGLPDEAPVGLGAPVSGGSRFYVRGDYLLWKTKGDRIPVLATTGIAQPIDRVNGSQPFLLEGILGQPGTTILFGGDEQFDDVRSGGRVSAGYWFGPCMTWGIEGSIFGLSEERNTFQATSAQFPNLVIARPFFNANFGLEDREIVGAPALQDGRLLIDTYSRFGGADLNLARRTCCGCWGNWEFFGGFRYLNLEEGITVSENNTITTTLTRLLPNGADTGIPLLGFPAGTNFRVVDSFQTRNDFYGGQLGARTEWRYGRWSLEFLGKLGLGDSRQKLTVNGQLTQTLPTGQRTQAVGGLLALPSNIGTFTRDKFAVVPELGLNLGFQLTPRIRLFAGYNFLYWSSVLRPGDQIDRGLNILSVPFLVPDQLRGQVPQPGLARPGVLLKDSDFWAHGVNFGLEFRF